MKSREILSHLQVELEMDNMSFSSFIQELRIAMFEEYLYIMNNVSYDMMVCDLVDLGIVKEEVLTQIDYD